MSQTIWKTKDSIESQASVNNDKTCPCLTCVIDYYPHSVFSLMKIKCNDKSPKHRLGEWFAAGKKDISNEEIAFALNILSFHSVRLPRSLKT